MEEGRLKVRKFGVYVWDGPHFFQAFKRKIAVCQCLLAGIPLGEARSGKAAATCRPQSKHLYCALKRATSQYASWKRLSTLPRAVEKGINIWVTPSPHHHPNMTISSLACGALTCLSGRKNTGWKMDWPKFVETFSQHSPVWPKIFKLERLCDLCAHSLTNRERCLD